MTRYDSELSMIIAAKPDNGTIHGKRKTKFFFLCVLYAANVHNFPESPITQPITPESSQSYAAVLI